LVKKLKRYRVLFLGPHASGKTYLIKRIVNKNFKEFDDFPIIKDVEYIILKEKNKIDLIEFYVQSFYLNLELSNQEKFLQRCNLVILTFENKDFNQSSFNQFIAERFQNFKNNPLISGLNYINVVNKLDIHSNLPKKTIGDNLLNISYFIDLFNITRSSKYQIKELKSEIRKKMKFIPNQFSAKKIENLLASKSIKDQIEGIYLIGKYHLFEYNEFISEKFLSKELVEELRIAIIWTLGELRLINHKDKLLKLYRSYRDGWDEEKLEMILALLKLDEPNFSPIKSQQLVKKEYLAKNQKQFINLLLEEKNDLDAILIKRSILYKTKKIIKKQNQVKKMFNGETVFLAFVEEDEEIVNHIYDKLKDNGLKPYMYTRDKIGGEKWGEKIPQRIKESNFVILCFSRKAIVKEGFFQKEVHYAISNYELKPDDTIYLIALGLDDCKIPYRRVDNTNLLSLTYLSLEKDTIYSILKSLKVQVEKNEINLLTKD